MRVQQALFVRKEFVLFLSVCSDGEESQEAD